MNLPPVRDLLPPPGRTNVPRRAFGAFLCLLPLWLPAGSLVHGLLHPGTPPFAGVWWLVAGAPIVVINAALLTNQILRPIPDPDDPVRGHASPAPLGGSPLVLVGVLWGYGAIGTATLALLAALVDSGGLPFFLIGTWRDRSFWDEPHPLPDDLVPDTPPPDHLSADRERGP